MIIAGAGSAGKEALALYLSTGKNDVILYDDNKNCEDYIFDKFKVMKTEEELKKAIENNPEFCVAIGHPRLRKKVFEKIIALGGVPRSIVNRDMTYSVSKLADNNACIYHPCASISYDFKTGISCLIHSGVVISHKVTLGNFVNVSPSCTIIGPCEIGDETYLEVGSTILGHHKIGHNAIIKAGKVVDRDVMDYETFE